MLKELFSTDIGLLSVFTIAVAAIVITYLYSFVRKKMDEDAGK